jgi:two-component system OmpR family sensor kinase
MFSSISWRLQVSYGLLFLGMLLALGCFSYALQRANRLQAIDARLHSRSTQLAGTLYRRPLGGRPEASPGTAPVAIPMVPRMAALFDEAGPVPHYYLVREARPGGRLLYRSRTAPDLFELLPDADAIPSEGLMRIRGEARELMQVNRGGLVFLVGRNISSELVEIRRQAGRLLLGGAGVLLGGLFASGWVARRSLKPIADISAAAQRIAGGDMAERIQTSDSRTELGQLAEVLNHSFDELGNAYQRQSQFTSDAAHELRTPISILLTETQSTLHQPRSAEDYRESLEVCLETARSMRELTDGLLAVARLDAGMTLNRRDRVDLVALVEACLEKLEPKITGRSLEVKRALNPVVCQGDPVQLEQVITNLLNNAVSYNRDGGELVVSLSGEGGVVLEVADTGIGISAEDLPQVFDRFYRADKARGDAGHSGLGLAISRQIVEVHGGDLTVQSTPGEGSVFTLRLPLERA